MILGDEQIDEPKQPQAVTQNRTESISSEAAIHLRRCKESLRSEMRQVRAALPLDEADHRSRRAGDFLVDVVTQRQPRLIAMYAARGREIATHETATRLLRLGFALSYPRVAASKLALDFHRVPDLSALETGRFGISEPIPHNEIVAPGRIELFVVPGLAFDRLGGRLGWGKGHYDATLETASGLRVGFCFESQIIDRVPRDEHDVLMDVLVTDVGIINVARPDQRPDHAISLTKRDRSCDMPGDRMAEGLGSKPTPPQTNE